MKIAFKTLGCKVNQYETQLIKEQFLDAGFREVSSGCPADVYVINTCTVTQKTDSESRRLIRNARKKNPVSRIVVTGCYAELDRDEIEKVADKLLIIKNSEKNKILQYFILDNRHSNTKKCLSPNYIEVTGTIGNNIGKTTISRFEGRTKAFVKVQDGCDNFCSYCKVPLVRGRSISRKVDEIIGEITQLISNGYKEIILSGICLGDWGRKSSLKLNWLLDEIENKVYGDFRVRISSIEPWYVTSELIQKIANSKKVCRHLHIPMQSGDDEVLRNMNRDFSSADFVALINRLRSLIPEAAFTTDVLVGFPGETEEQFKNTLRVVGLTRPSRVHIFPYSRRKGTKAYNFKDTAPNHIARDRINRLKAIADNLAVEYKRQFIGKAVEVLVESKRDRKTGLLVGYTDTYVKVAFQGPDELKGTLRSIKMPSP